MMEVKQKHILVISQYFYPEQFRINDMCKEWIARGYKVTVLTGIPNYPEGKYYKGYGLFKRRRENYEGAEVIRIPLVPRGNNAIMLALNYLSFVISGFFWKMFTRVKADSVFIFEVSPMTQALPGVWYARKHKIPCYLYVQDLWPENVEIITGITNPKIIGVIGKMVDYIYKHCTRIFTTSNSFVTSIANRGVAKEKIEYWPQYAEDFYQPVLRENSESENEAFQIMFTGNIGFAQGLDILPKVAMIIKEKQLNRKIIFHLVGDGRYKEELVHLVEESDLADMFRFTSRKPAIEIPELLSTAHVAFLCLTDNPIFKMTIPAKLQSYMACGKPIIASASGETAEIVMGSNAGFISPVGNIEALADKIVEASNLSADQLTMLGKNARSYYEKHFSKEELLDRMDTYFQL